MELHEWDAVEKIRRSAPVRTISLGIGGVNAFRKDAGDILLIYLCPWAPADNLHCLMGYGQKSPKITAEMLVVYLGLNHPDVAARPLPWNTSPAAAAAYLKQWRAREWHGWLAERIDFPFAAVVQTAPNRMQVEKVDGLVESTPAHAQRMGVYFDVPVGGWNGNLVAGATTVTPIDVTSSAAAALCEYRAYRKRVGPPPGVAGGPEFLRVK